MTVAWPASAHIVDGTPIVNAHTRGAEGSGGHYAFERAPGARIDWSLSVAPMATADALAFRAFLHSLRGADTIRIPAPARRDGAAAFSAEYSLALAVSAMADTMTLTPGEQLHVGDFVRVSTVAAAVDVPAFSDTTDFSDAFGFEDDGAEAVAFSDDALFSDGRGFSDTWGAPIMVEGDTAQTVRVVAVAGDTVTVRPRVRTAFAAGALVRAGAVAMDMRLAPGGPPRVPLVARRSLPLQINLQEAY